MHLMFFSLFYKTNTHFLVPTDVKVDYKRKGYLRYLTVLSSVSYHPLNKTKQWIAVGNLAVGNGISYGRCFSMAFALSWTSLTLI